MLDVTVVVPLHNKGRHIARALDSVLRQRMQPRSVIVVDDASTDEGPEVVDRYIRAGSSIELVRRETPGAGGYAARNEGVKRTTTRWVAFLDADDEWTPAHLDRFEQALEWAPDLRVYSAAYVLEDGEHGAPAGLLRGLPTSDDGSFRSLRFEHYLRSIVSRRQAMWTSASILERALVIAVGGFPELASFGGDTDTWIRAVHSAGKLVWSPVVGAVYHLDSDNMTTKSSTAFDKPLNVVLETCRALNVRERPAVARLLAEVESRKYYDWVMARKRFSRRLWSFAPGFKWHYLIDRPHLAAVLIPNPVFRLSRRIRASFITLRP